MVCLFIFIRRITDLLTIQLYLQIQVIYQPNSRSFSILKFVSDLKIDSSLSSSFIIQPSYFIPNVFIFMKIGYVHM